MKDRLLSAAERYFKTDINYLLRGGFWLTAAKGLSAIASLISSVAFANLLPEETYGAFRYVLSISALLAIPTLHGMENALTRSVAKGMTGTIPAAIKTRIKWGVLAGLLSLGVSGYYLLAGNIELSLSFLVAAIFLPFMDPFHTYAAVLSGLKKFNTLAVDEVVTRMLVAILLAGSVFFIDSIAIIVLIFFGTTTLLRLLFLRKTLASTPQNNQVDHELISYGKHLSGSHILIKISTQIDKVLVFHFVGGAALAGFYLALMPFKQIQNLFNGVATLALPKLSLNSKEVIKKTLPRKLLHAYVITVPIVAAYWLLSPYIFAFLFPAYTDYVFVSQLLMSLLLLSPAAIFHTALTSQGEKKKLYVHSLVYASFRIITLLVLVPQYGVMGATVTLMLTTVLSTSSLTFLFLRMKEKGTVRANAAK